MYQVEVIRSVPLGPIPNLLFRRIVEKVLAGEGVRDAAIGIVFMNDRRIRAYNLRFLRHDWATDVLTFPLESEPVLEAEIFISAQTARRQSVEYAVSLRYELSRLLVHGLLHLCGYDDANERESIEMRKRENAYLTHFFRSW